MPWQLAIYLLFVFLNVTRLILILLTGIHSGINKVIDNVPLDTINQNYALPYKKPFNNVTKRIVIDYKGYKMREAVAFNAPKRGVLR